VTALVAATGLSLPGRLADLSLELRPGELVGLIGPNGSGKTSLLHALAGIGRPRGSVRIGTSDPHRLAPTARNRLVGYLPANREVAWPLSARDLIALGGAGAAEVEAVIDRLALGPVAGRRVDRLSTGERSRVLIARVLAPAPALLLLDEPTANLDPLWQLRLLEMLREDLRAGEQAILIAIHDLDLAALHCDRLILLDNGRVAADGDPMTVLASGEMRRVFGIERVGGRWRPLAG
jgi:iron complex transport system ATP-binding protein